MTMMFFAEMGWKSALIAGAALALTYALRSRSAADRALVLRIGIVMLLLLPWLALWLPALEIVAFAAPESPRFAGTLPAGLDAATLSGFAAAAPEPTIWDDPTPLVLLAYVGGLAMVGSRLLGGLWTLRRWTRSARDVEDEAWLAAFDRQRWIAPAAERVTLKVSDEVRSPLSWGWIRPVILIDPDSLNSPDDADAILAHELAHVARRDWPALIMSRVAATLFWFNPLVWVLDREIVQQAEEAADCTAAERVEPALYAQTLLSWARTNSLVPANSIAPRQTALGRRVRAILDRRVRERPSGSAWTAFAMLLCLVIAAPVAAAQLVAAEPEREPADDPAPVETLETPQFRDAIAAIEGVTVEGGHIGPEVREALDSVLPRLPEIIADARAAIDPEQMRAVAEAARTELANMPPIDREQIRAAIREAHASKRLSRDQYAAVAAAHPAPVMSRREIERIRRDAERAARTVHRPVEVSLAGASEGMMRGAEGMESGARRMEEEARKLDDPQYRERQIARARARGEEVTHEDLIEAAEGLREGAQGLREGAEEMRRSAREMRTRTH